MATPASTPASPQPQRPQQASSSAPQPLTPGWLSAHFDPLPFPARASALARYARALTPAAYQSLHRALDKGTDHERHRALFLAVARRDLPTVAAALTDPALRRRALSAAIRLPVAEQALEQLALSPLRAVRHDTYRVLKHSRRRALADALLPRVHERYGDDDAARLLTACPASTADRWLPRLDPPHGVLRTLARTAPVAVARLLADMHARIEPHDRRARYAFDRAHRPLACLAARRDPDAGLVLVWAAPHLLEGEAVLSVLRRPAAVLEALRAAPEQRRKQQEEDHGGSPRAELPVPPGPLPRSVRKALLHLSPDDLADFAERCTEGARRLGFRQRYEVAPDGLLTLLPPAERRRVITRRAEGRRNGLGALSITALAALAPEDRAELTAADHDGRTRGPRIASRRAVALPLDQAEPILLDLAAQHRLHDCALAWPALLACAELNGDPQEFVRIATACERAWHDRDEIRLRTLTQLAGAPRHLLAALPRKVLRDAALTAVQSGDTSPATLLEADRLLRRATVVAADRDDHENAAHGVELLCELLNDPRHPSHPQPATHPPRRHGDRHRAGTVPALPIDATTARAAWEATAPRTRDTPTLCVPLAELLAPHLPHLPELDDRVHHIALHADDPTLAARAAEAWVTPRRLREQRCAELLAHDPSYASVPRILHTVTTRRTDLLDHVIAAAAHGLTGHLRPRPTPWAPRITPATMGRWLPEQRSAQNQHYARVAQDETAPLLTRAAGASQLRARDLLTTLAADAPQPVAAAALTALGATDEPPADQHELHALLLRHAGTGGVRGRAAMAALRRLLGTRPADEAIALLSGVLTTPGSPVGSRKEAARALGELPDAGAFDALLAAWDTDGQHRDVRAALAPFLVPRIDRPDIADRLAAHLTEPAIRETVLHARVQHDSATVTPPSATYLAFLIRLLHRRTDTDRETTVAICRVLPNRCAPDTEAALQALAELIADPAREPEVWGAAAEALGRFPSEGTAARRVLLPLWNELRTRAGTAGPGDGPPAHDGMPPGSHRADALRRLAACADTIQNASRHGHAAGPGADPDSGADSGSGGDTGSGGGWGEVVDGLADALEAVGLHERAVRLLRGALVSALQRGWHYQPERWDRLLSTVEERQPLPGPLSLPASAPASAPAALPAATDPALTAVRDLRARGTSAAAQLAVELVRSCGERSSWPPAWRAELDALRRHPDAETSAEALLVDPGAD
ncbi:hypothetical protein RCO28_14955 [Streptomyces sp. LHD-70]|uniref:hypothetical protein n=1 Tax=Streptomyces sp. LHD-70 TaxID=3072140 RepID=UPI00280F617B|nr:hypothetical protein [Streptomyces sp. LHD-70]MDQ8703780.1 hypothetical protein [Streptomyces sp. LHD-70]